MGGRGGHHFKWNKPDIKTNIAYSSPYVGAKKETSVCIQNGDY